MPQKRDMGHPAPRLHHSMPSNLVQVAGRDPELHEQVAESAGRQSCAERRVPPYAQYVLLYTLVSKQPT